jgi:ketosteroid isomerase-like protein
MPVMGIKHEAGRRTHMSHEQQETSDAALSLVKEFFAAKERHDLDATMALFSEDAVYIFPLSASGKQENWLPIRTKKSRH